MDTDGKGGEREPSKKGKRRLTADEFQALRVKYSAPISEKPKIGTAGH
jgi:hypothetical protein